MSSQGDHQERPSTGQSSDDNDGQASWYHELEELAEAEDDDDADGDPDYQDDLDDDDEFHDAEDGDIEFQVVIDHDNADDMDDDEDDDGDGTIRQMGTAQSVAARIAALISTGGRGTLTGVQLRALLRNRDRIFGNTDDDEDEDGLFVHWTRRRRREPKDPNRFPKVPSEEGIKLQRSGVFGANDHDRRIKKHIARLALDRELGLGDRQQRRMTEGLLVQNLLPGTSAEHIVHYNDPIYSGQFSDDGNFFFSCCQDFKVRMYDTSNPYNWKHYKTVNYPWGHWTLTDASLSPDNKWLAYTSIAPMVSIAPTDPLDSGDPYTLNLADGNPPGRRGGWRTMVHDFGIWSVRFSGDGRELVAGTSSHSIVVYDIESRRTLHNIEGHGDDVNAVCFADKSAPHILYSGSDDALVKVWDRRSMGDSREVGAFVGHTEGLTYIDSKDDGRYLISNGKDQTMKLWDLRMVMSTAQFSEVDPQRHTRNSGFDYRRDPYDEEDWDPHPNDNSVVTFRGHKVLRTLIRCHFSPPNATNSRYVYSGSADGKVYVWNMDATLAKTIDVRQATLGTRQVDRHTRLYFQEPSGWGTCVRDASWHPNGPYIVASALNGYSFARGTCTMHSFNDAEGDESGKPIGTSVNAYLEKNPELYDRYPHDEEGEW